MKTFLIAVLGAAVLVLPAAAVAKPDHADKRAAIKQCKAERADPDFASTHDGKSFKEVYGNFGKCVSTKAHEQKRAEDQDDAQEVQAFKNAAKECAAERSDTGFPATHDGKSFEDFYGSNHNKRNAFGKCVSSKAPPYTDPLS